MKKTFLSIVAIFLLLPIIVEAANDTSWFNENTYDTTTTYTIKNENQLFGLEYLVNTKGYTFEGKTIIIKPISTSECRYWNVSIGANNCRIDISAYHWTPLSSSFKGTFNIANGVNGTYRIILRDGEYLIENNGKCKYDAGSYSVNLEGNCPVAIHNKRYQYTYNNPEHGTFTITPNGGGYFDKFVYVKVNPDEGYTVGKITVKDENENKVDITSLYGNTYYILQPDSNLHIEVTFVPEKKYTIESIPTIEHNTTNGKCELIAGDGKSLGSEVKCGSEYFYVIKNDGQNVKLLAKYNLLLGENIYKVKVDKSPDDSRPNEIYCSEEASRNGYSARSDNFYSAEGYCFFTKNNYDLSNLYQHPKAVSAHWDKNDVYQYPQIGDIYITAQQGNPSSSYDYDTAYQDLVIDPNSSSKYEGLFYDLVYGDRSKIEIYLKAYKYSLENLGYTVNSIDMLTLEDLSDIINSNNKTIPYQDWYNHTRTIAPPHYEFAQLKDYLSDEQSYMYGTTYWIRAGYGLSNNIMGIDNLVFINTTGGICSSGVIQGSYIGSNCQSLLNLKTTLGAGLRPVVTIPAEIVPTKYNIKTQTDGNGKIEVVKTADGDEEITFKVESNKGYVLGELKIIADSGETVIFNEGELKENGDGTITISSNKFKMPFEDVTIIASFKKEQVSIVDMLKNPDTGDIIFLVLIMMIISAVLVLYFYKLYKVKQNNV